MSAEDSKVDTNLYSRQIGTFGIEKYLSERKNENGKIDKNGCINNRSSWIRS